MVPVNLGGGGNNNLLHNVVKKKNNYPASAPGDLPG